MAVNGAGRGTGTEGWGVSAADRKVVVSQNDALIDHTNRLHWYHRRERSSRGKLCSLIVSENDSLGWHIVDACCSFNGMRPSSQILSNTHGFHPIRSFLAYVFPCILHSITDCVLKAAILDQVQKGDIVVFEWGHNDGGSIAPDSTRPDLFGDSASTGQLQTNTDGSTELVRTFV